ncbi:UDP-N-acetylglucosamine pyrophosphorylase mmy [Megachile rotundata]|uniref:UDP-N-acetylglucosamine pyrophosphorylase mmy n=1 Tax=Megachile rotundata TaxID=143995 RepID=UPI000258D401|nr:PREDICTED: UDP-N-acetylhexosamine pyrophosphorylase [Megachile rotundata]XP_012134840.1 PREDICTED: UDP-N-acetylhexosamine pyrophosphorylase [Megachile rotundata]XP_012134848.1 PREDICTED: UDP-N-acetylhexosamine pyrophosphorylase [Megachile rotundata]XP_012134857.1 PREDICTED: UDP-N-acetylhexosamine pyrophosphorylase [Megachile rotundata]XP_012134863.1 PREDICTED: UDP-N-acetylhexosamine pyrophosphorylase [Megachile rotundata]XP_012134872.1 PREDICTED: UDP-N-acetylhexosamine pyrophosphorylase [Me
MESLRTKLAEYGQEHLLKFWDQLSEKERNELHQDLSKLNLVEVTSYLQKATYASSCMLKNTLDDKVSPIPKESIGSVKTASKKQLEAYEKLGLQEVANGRVGVLLMAGGQGTRLGVSYPKGMYNVGLPSGKTLFQLQAERILRLQNIAEKEYGKKGEITWYILTSEATHDTTVSFLRKHNYFGLKEENVKAFKQGMLPCFTFDGKIILDEKHKISKAPDGNGGLYRALKEEGILDDMRQRGIRSVHVHSVDNILIKVADPVFLGYCLSSSTDCGVKVIEKSSPNEPVGVVCKVDGIYQVVEYSEISKETAELRYNDGQLVYNAANICNHYFTVDFLRTVADIHEQEMDLHVAKKKIPYIDDDGNRHTPTTPNGIKIEKFVFDVFKFAKQLTVWEGIREEDFSPLKNADSAGQDCPSTGRNDVLKLHKKWLLNAGALDVINDVEISPLLSYAGENLSHVKGQSFEGPYVVE